VEAWKPVAKEITTPVVATTPVSKLTNWSSILQRKDTSNPPPQSFASTPSVTVPAHSILPSYVSPQTQSSVVLPSAAVTPTVPAVAKKVEEILDEIDQDNSLVERKQASSSRAISASHIMMNPIFDDDYGRHEDDEEYPEWADEELPPVEFSFDNNYFGQSSMMAPSSTVIGQNKPLQQPPSPTASLYSPPFFSQSPESTSFFPSHSPPSSSSGTGRFGGPSLFSFLPSPPPENGPTYLLQPHATYHNPLFGGGSNTDSPVSLSTNATMAPNTSPSFLPSFSRTPGPSRPKQTSPSTGQYQLF